MSRSCEEGKYSENRRSYLCLWCGCGTIGAAPDFLDELRAAMHTLSKKYAPALTDERIEKAFQSEMPALAVLEIEIEQLSGKEAFELVRQRKG